MSTLSQQLTAEYVLGVLGKDSPVGELLQALEDKGYEMGKTIHSLEEFDGENQKQGKLRVLKACPMTPVIEEIKQRNGGRFPAHFDAIVEAFKAKYPSCGAISHPLCIIHQVVRSSFCVNHDWYCEEVACRSAASGQTVVSQNGLIMSGMTEDEARSTVSNAACMYFLEESTLPS